MKRVNGNDSNGAGPATAEAPIPTASQKRMILSAIGKAKFSLAEKVVIYGPEGIGKTWWANQWERPIFISAESGLKGIDPVPDTFPEPQSWEDILEAVNELRNQKHDFKTLVIDTADWAEALCEKMVCKKNKNVASIEHVGGGFGKGYVMASEEWRGLLLSLNHLAEQAGMNVVITAHSQVKAFNNPEGDNYDRFQMKINDRVSAIIKEWADSVLFAKYEIFVNDDGGRGKGFGGKKIIHATHSPAWDAKNRYKITETIPMEFPAFWKYVEAAHTAMTAKGGK